MEIFDSVLQRHDTLKVKRVRDSTHPRFHVCSPLTVYNSKPCYPKITGYEGFLLEKAPDDCVVPTPPSPTLFDALSRQDSNQDERFHHGRRRYV